jgi:hypothetical protein
VVAYLRAATGGRPYTGGCINLMWTDLGGHFESLLPCRYRHGFCSSSHRHRYRIRLKSTSGEIPCRWLRVMAWIGALAVL